MAEVQEKTRMPGRLRGGHAGHAALLLLGLPLLAACSADSANPINWWHDLEGGRIADERPPPPNSEDPYPNLSTVPTKPQVTDAAARGRIANALIADRANAQYGASLAPVGIPAAQRPVTPPAAPSTMSASLQAASAPPLPPGAQPAAEAPVVPPRRAPVASVQASTLPPPDPSVPAVEAGPMPAIPAAPPAPPSLAGVPATVVPTPPVPTPPAAVVPPAAPGGPVAVPFAAGSAQLQPQAQAPLKALALSRAGAAIAVIGYGDATGPDAAAQVAAMPLAWQRAQAISGALQAAGVPMASLRIAAEAEGRGGVARIAN